ncbi:MAG: thioredoxin domain-containing protein [Paracoccaceae bacterium]|nr:thioredoxin domain-containing protein [Paracoccaceae bacterium]
MIRRSRKLALALTATLALAGPATAIDFNALSPADRSALDTEIHNYIVTHPEVLVEAYTALQTKQADAQANADAALVKANADAIFKDGYSYVGGNPKGNITLVEFTDYRCTYCRRAYNEVNELVKSDGNIRFIVKEFPILGDQSTISARYAIAVMQADGPAVYDKIHDALITFRGEVNKDSLTRLSNQFGLNATDLLARMDSPEVTKVINENHALGNALQINGTPTFVVADQMWRGYVPLDNMRQILAKIRSE